MIAETTHYMHSSFIKCIPDVIVIYMFFFFVFFGGWGAVGDNLLRAFKAS